MSDRLELSHKRHQAIQAFLDENAELFGITETDDVGEGPFFLTDWGLVLHLRDMSVEDHTYEPNEVRAAFFRPGMGYSAKIGMIAALDEGIRFPRHMNDEESED